ncbi:hypothetical protein Purlil1_8901 [Purpureocillium lilacinum]|uniref:Uncharacterized protein n=1 Tax=Purpureocillium lilacinum TaxID=33203 RepID=A0ABR0BS28_PURLI|nr:hypothetical protein Purlil1_8901 [Purpureocillium lilacinum]
MSARDPTQEDRAAGAGAAAAAHHQPWARRYWSQLLHPAGSLGRGGGGGGGWNRPGKQLAAAAVRSALLLATDRPPPVGTSVGGPPPPPQGGSHTDVTAFCSGALARPVGWGEMGRPGRGLGWGWGWAGLVAGFGAVGAGRAGFAKDRPWGFAAATMTWARVAMWLDGCDGLDGGLEGLSCSCLRAETQDASCAETAERIDQIPRGSNAEILLVVYSQPGDPWMLLHETDPLAFAWPDRALDYFDGAAHHAPSLTLAAAAAASHASHHSCIGANYSSPSPRARGWRVPSGRGGRAASARGK